MKQLSPFTGNTSPRPLVSVVIPAFNVEHELARSVQSVLGQTMRDMEILLLDDASRDGTLALARQFEANDARVRVLRNTSNLGVSASRNRLLQEARGEWVAFTDGDDAWLPQRLERLLGVAGADRADVLADDVYRVAQDGQASWSCLRERWYRPLVLLAPTWLTADDLLRHHLGALKPVVRRQFLTQHGLAFDPALHVYEDFLFYVRLALSGARWLQVPEGYYLYFTRRASLTSGRVMLTQGPRVLAAFQALLEDPQAGAVPGFAASLAAFLRQTRASMLLEAVAAACLGRDFQQAARLLVSGRADLPPACSQLSRRTYVRVRRLWRSAHLAAPGAGLTPTVASSRERAMRAHPSPGGRR